MGRGLTIRDLRGAGGSPRRSLAGGDRPALSPLGSAVLPAPPALEPAQPKVTVRCTRRYCEHIAPYHRVIKAGEVIALPPRMALQREREGYVTPVEVATKPKVEAVEPEPEVKREVSFGETKEQPDKPHRDASGASILASARRAPNKASVASIAAEVGLTLDPDELKRGEMIAALKEHLSKEG